MATQAEIQRSYDPIDRLHRAALGPHADVTGAFYDGDFSLSLAEAQARKHDLILDGLGLGPGDTLLDIGCGWGPLLKVARERGIVAKGVSLSPAQVARCRAAGLDATLMDWKEIDPTGFGPFDGIASVGAFEHFASPNEAAEGLQDRIYDAFFRRCAVMLPPGGKLFLQTMTWGKRVPSPDELDVHAPSLSDEWVMGYLACLYPGSWLPHSAEHVIGAAAPYFAPTYVSNGRLDYLQTMGEWGRAVRALGWKKWRHVAPTVWRALVSTEGRRFLTALRSGCARLCFEREIFQHYRMVFLRRDDALLSAP